MLKHLLVGAVAVSSLAFADSRYHQAVPVAPPPPPANVLPAVIVPEARGGDRMTRDDRVDVRTAQVLMREFETAVAYRDERAMRRIDARFAVLLDGELAEARSEGRGRFDRDDRRSVELLMNLRRQLERVQGRVDRFAVNQKRSVYAQVTAIAERDLRDNRFDRHDAPRGR